MTKNEFLKQATNEQMDCILSSKSADELLILAKEFDVQLNETEAAEAMEKITHNTSTELSDDELENVAGGGTHKGGYPIVTIGYSCDLFRKKPNSASETQENCSHCEFHKCYKGLDVCVNVNNKQNFVN